MRYVPLAINKPSFEECKRVFNILTTCYFYKRDYIDGLKEEKNKKKITEPAVVSSRETLVVDDNQNFSPSHVSEVVEAAATEIYPPVPEEYRETYQQLLDCLRCSDVSVLSTLPLPSIVNCVADTSPLHIAAEHSTPDVVTILLEAGADVSISIRGKCPYHVAKDKTIRDAFRRYYSYYSIWCLK